VSDDRGSDDAISGAAHHKGSSLSFSTNQSDFCGKNLLVTFT